MSKYGNQKKLDSMDQCLNILYKDYINLTPMLLACNMSLYLFISCHDSHYCDIRIMHHLLPMVKLQNPNILRLSWKKIPKFVFYFFNIYFYDSLNRTKFLFLNFSRFLVHYYLSVTWLTCSSSTVYLPH